MRIIASLIGIFAISGCTDHARVFPLDAASMEAGIPKMEFTRYGMGHGPVTFTMPDGEILTGEFQVTENAAIGVGFAGSRTTTAVAYGSGRPVVVSAIGPKTIMNCDGSADIGGHGSLSCQTNKGAAYRLMF